MPTSTAATLVLLCIIATISLCHTAAQANWTSWGGDIQNRRFASHKCLDVGKLKGGMKVKWQYTTLDTAAPTPTVCKDFVYFSDWRANVIKMPVAGGAPVWVANVKAMLPKERSVGVRVTPTLNTACTKVYVFTQWTVGAFVVGISTVDGSRLFVQQIDPHPLARVTMSPTYYDGSLFIGMSSATEGSGTDPTFRGSMYRVDGTTGAVVWSTPICPAGYTGCALWGSSPAIDVRRGQVCVGTGNNYGVPAQVAQCYKNAGANIAAQRLCDDKANLADAVVCFSLRSGKVKWASRLAAGADVYLPGYVEGPDLDYAQAPILVTRRDPSQDILLATSKGSLPMGFDPLTGKAKWGPVKVTDVMNPFTMFGSCTNNQIYCTGQFWFGQKIGQVTCLRVSTGQIVWKWITQQGGVYGALTCTEKVVFVPLFNDVGSLVALSIDSGEELGRWDSGKTLFTGPAIVNGVAYLGQGYNANGGVAGNQVFAVALPLDGKC